ncbi:amidohydrolase [Aestuariimicrobium sp. p3-SID1156]|uniref:amidohydrolase n=1 Tax=Aestuariimicrobium sp. p3-SID1156 TaxID=2916038 RepID=UPI00223AC862|nr:amidohydrolase [Aestuariimicrobium sp. p3-SID1156]MCT1459457.1 amidohydrolase [Aestuariimicrobium sp. p3-SID1156]
MTTDRSPIDATAISALIDENRTELEDLYRHLHAHPELSNQEVATARRMAEELRAIDGVEVHEQVGRSTGVVGILNNGEGPVVLLRADMDGLPVREREQVDYRSEATGTWEGEESPVMHACGHDTHMTGLVGAMRVLAALRHQWSGTVVAVFQPAEEIVDGARGMVDALRELVPHIDIALGQHVWPGAAGTVHLASGPVMASTDGLRLVIHGRGGHGSQPEMTIDPVVLASHIVVRLQTIVSREVAPQGMAVITVGAFHAGSKGNIIPPKAELDINIRSYSEQVREHLKTSIERVVNAECAAAGEGARAEFEWLTPAPVTVNDEDATVRVARAFDAAFGDRHVVLDPVSASEDFTILPAAYGAPSVFWMFGGFGDQPWPSNHSPEFIPLLQPTLDTGVQALVAAALEWLSRD